MCVCARAHECMFVCLFVCNHLVMSVYINKSYVFFAVNLGGQILLDLLLILLVINDLAGH